MTFAPMRWRRNESRRQSIYRGEPRFNFFIERPVFSSVIALLMILWVDLPSLASDRPVPAGDSTQVTVTTTFLVPMQK
jgi:hypothetical protein